MIDLQAKLKRTRNILHDSQMVAEHVYSCSSEREEKKFEKNEWWKC